MGKTQKKAQENTSAERKKAIVALVYKMVWDAGSNSHEFLDRFSDVAEIWDYAEEQVTKMLSEIGEKLKVKI